ncbi:MAG: PaaI family thioesterase [Thermoguttaceae bacterium]
MTHDLDAVRARFKNDRFAATSGVELVELRPGYAKACLKIEDRHLNGVDIVQGGAIFTLADFAFAAACNSADRVAVAISTNLSFLEASRSGTLWAEAVENGRSTRIANATVRVTDDAGRLVALLQGTAYVKDLPSLPQ